MRLLETCSVFSASAQLFDVLHFMFLFLSSAYTGNTFSLLQTDLQPAPHCSVFSSEVTFTREPYLTSAGWPAHDTVLGFLAYLLIITKGLCTHQKLEPCPTDLYTLKDYHSAWHKPRGRGWINDGKNVSGPWSVPHDFRSDGS